MELFSLGINLLLIILGFGLLIFIHELGHFLAAKWAGIRTEAFAVGMGPVIVAWRKGIGFAPGSTHGRVLVKAGKPPDQLTDEELATHGIGETEYSLRWLPIGGFVKMLGQDDMDPAAASKDDRSFNRCPIGKRMVVISAGVIMNLVLAAVLFIIAFMVGVRFEASVVGSVAQTMPAGLTMPENADELGIGTPGMKPDDEVVAIDGRAARTFADIQIAAAMARPDVPVTFEVQRAGYDEPLRFVLEPQRDPATRLLSIGVGPASTTTLISRDDQGVITRVLRRTGLYEQGVRPGMRLLAVNGEAVETYPQFSAKVAAAEGETVMTTWQSVDRRGSLTGEPIEATVRARPVYATLPYHDREPDDLVSFEQGLFGITPLVRIAEVGDGPNREVLRTGDAVLQVAERLGPRMREFRTIIQQHDLGPIDLVVLRDGERKELTATVSPRGAMDREGVLNVFPDYAWDVPYMAEPMDRIGRMRDGNRATIRTPSASLDLFPATRINTVAGRSVENWADIRSALIEATSDAVEADEGAEIELTVTHPTPGEPTESVTLRLDADDVAHLHELGWRNDVPSAIFEPLYTTRTAEGNPFRAIVMGIEETHKILMLTYVTIDRLFRGTVGVEQLHGPVGIVHVGTRIADRGIMYLIFFLAMISVNLAVINFLPLPILDGGHFLMLVYEKITGRPPSVLFLNVITIIGLFLIGTLILVVTYHDLLRLFS